MPKLYSRTIVVRDHEVTSAAFLTMRQSLVPNLLGISHSRLLSTCALLRPDSRFRWWSNSAVECGKTLTWFGLAVTILFFLWGFAYGLLDGEPA